MNGTEANELLEAVRVFLRQELLPELEGFKAYNTRVAANALGIVQRELELGGRIEALDREVAQALGLDTQADSLSRQVALGLRNGTLAADETLLSYLRRRTLLAMEIDNPKYSGLQHARLRWQAPDQA